MAGRRIAILMHEHSGARSVANYAIGTMMKFWLNDGHKVTVLFGTRVHEPADLLLVHVDLSVVPQDYLDFALQYPIALNAGVADVRKHTFADNLLDASDPYDGPVMVKSDLNHGGFPEQRLAALAAGAKRVSIAKPAYPIFERLAAVPREYFNNNDFVVQKFQPERDGDYYCVRYLFFMGDHLSSIRLRAPGPVVNGDTIQPGSSEVIEPHPDIIAMRQRLGFDYGKFDYVVVDGRAILLDTNKTIGNATASQTADIVKHRRNRARGLYAYFDGMQPIPVPRPASGPTRQPHRHLRGPGGQV